MMRAALFSAKDRRHAYFYPLFAFRLFTFAFARRNAPTRRGIKNAHQAGREKFGKLGAFRLLFANRCG
jgi:hypothetical protein